MGCDIHTVVERRVDDGWVAEAIDMGDIRHRDYYVFESMAQVRGSDGEAPRGFPDDASDTTIMLNKDGETDWHSHSWLALDKAMRLYIRGKTRNPWATDFDADKISVWNVFGVEYEYPIPESDRRIVFWFDN